MRAFPNSLNPHKEESMELIKSMIDQIMAIHNDIRWLHIGSDEVMQRYACGLILILNNLAGWNLLAAAIISLHKHDQSWDYA